MRDLNNIAIVGDSEINTSITNAVAGHTFSWIAGATTGTNVTECSISNLTFINTDTTGTYYSLNIDGNAVTYPNTFLYDEFDLNYIDVDGSGTFTQPTAYF
jgi:hypothetical protein